MEYHSCYKIFFLLILRNLKITSVIIAASICSKQQCKTPPNIVLWAICPTRCELYMSQNTLEFSARNATKKKKLWELALNSVYQILVWERGEEFVINLLSLEGRIASNTWVSFCLPRRGFQIVAVAQLCEMWSGHKVRVGTRWPIRFLPT